MNKLFFEVVVCYDVQENRPRQRLFDSLKDLGLYSIQKSVFWGFVNNAEFKAIYREFKQHLNPKTDKAFVIKTSLKNSILTNGYGYIEGELPNWTEYETI
ncbi:MAG: CRISPR-associated endonuclease Cas2 [Candidatus Auribacterota bacterium]